MLKNLRNTLVRRGMQTAIQVTADAAASATTKSFRQVWDVKFPVAVVVRASYATVNVHRIVGVRIELQAELRASFGLEFVTDQDESGVYIVLKRKPVVGTISSAEFTLILPPEAHLSLNLTPGEVHLYDINGKINLNGG